MNWADPPLTPLRYPTGAERFPGCIGVLGSVLFFPIATGLVLECSDSPESVVSGVCSGIGSNWNTLVLGDWRGGEETSIIIKLITTYSKLTL